MDTGTYGKSLVIPVSTPDPQQFRIPAVYPTIELPSEEVVFAENLEEIAGSNILAEPETLFTATPGVAWIIEESQPTFEAGLPVQDIAGQAVTIPAPVFEQQDYQNDGPAALSALLRHFNKNESQYLISAAVKPDYFDPDVTFQQLAEYVRNTYPDLSCITRINGDETRLVSLLQESLPVIIRIEVQRNLPAWKGDDLWDGRYLLLTGFNSAERTFQFIDPAKGNRQSIPFDELMSLWYAFSREYLIVFSPEQESDVLRILNEDREEASNLNNALIKFQKDAEMAPGNVLTGLNAAAVLMEKRRYEEAWNLYQSARNLGMPQRYLLYNPAFYEAAFYTGNADALIAFADFTLSLNSHSEESHLWKGWGHLLREETEAAERSFQQALSIRPGYEDAVYALRFLQSQQ